MAKESTDLRPDPPAEASPAEVDKHLQDKLDRWSGHIGALVGRIEAASQNVASVHEYSTELAARMHRINERTEARVLGIQDMLTELNDSLDDHPEARAKVCDIVGRLQFQDILRQELEALEEAVRGFGELFTDLRSSQLLEVMAKLPEHLEAIRPRADIDPEDAPAKDLDLPPIELF